MKLATLLATFLILVFTVACNAPAQGQDPGADAVRPATAVQKVTVAKDGTKFDPPVAPEAIPEGSWYCEMGTVHYARGHKGDGKCPVCSMDLKEAKAGAAHPHPKAGSGHGMH